jgi:photosystem II stability/assembly factor-like uncharacterized protein
VFHRLIVCAASLVAIPAFAGVNTWTPAGPDGGSIYGGVQHVSQDTAVAVTTGGIYRTTNAAATWTRSFDFGAASVYSGVATNPAPATSQYVLAHGDGSRFVLRSVDGGVSFTRTEVTGDLTAHPHVSGAAFSRNGLIAWVGLSDGRMYRSTDFGATWTSRSHGLTPGWPIETIEVDATDPQRVWILSGAQLWRTVDGGANWAQLGGTDQYWSLFASKNVHDVLLAVRAGADGELFRSTDGGVTFTTTGRTHINTVAFSPSTTAPDPALAIDWEDRALVSADGGATWTLHPQRMPIEVAIEISFDPVTNDVVVATNSGVLYSSDAGLTWSVRNGGIHETSIGHLVARHDSSNAVYALTFDDQVVWRRNPAAGTWEGIGSMANAILSAQPGEGGFGLDVARSAPGTLFVVEEGQLGRSDDDGATWSALGHVNGARALAVDPQNPQVLYVGGGQPLTARKSIDGGMTWAPLAGLPAGIEEIVIDRANPQTLYAVRNSSANAAPAIYKSENGGASWAGAANGIDGNFVWKLVQHPADSQTLYVCSPGGVWRTKDGGANWTRIYTLASYDIAIHPDPPHTLYVSANESSARSVDDGANWEWLQASSIGGGNAGEIELVPGRAATVLLSKGNRGLNELTIAPDLRLTASAGEAFVGVRQGFTFTIANDSAFTATNVALVVTVPDSSDAYVSSSPTLTCVFSGNTFTCSSPLLRGGATATFTLSLTPTGDAQPFAASVAAQESDVEPLNNGVIIDLERRTDLRMELTTNVPAVLTAEEWVYRMTLTNLGPSPAVGARGVLTLPANATYVSATGALACSHVAGVVTCDAGGLEVGGSAQGEIRVRAASAGVASGTAVASAAPGASDRTAGNDQVTVAVTISDPATPAPTPTPTPTPPATPPASGGKKGGGGSLDYLLLALLTGAATLRRR